MAGFDLKDYVDVHQRIEKFYEKFPEGSIQTEVAKLDDSIVIMRAYAYRNPDDPRPSIGHSQLGIPGTTPYTRGSEIENAETSAVGRAIAFLGFETKNGIASAQEVRNKQTDTPRKAPSAPQETPQKPAGPRYPEGEPAADWKRQWLMAWAADNGIPMPENRLSMSRDAWFEYVTTTPEVDEEAQEEFAMA